MFWAQSTKKNASELEKSKSMKHASGQSLQGIYPDTHDIVLARAYE